MAELIRDAVARLGQSPHVQAVTVDAAGTLVLDVATARRTDFDRVIDVLAVNELGALFPGWLHEDVRTYLVACDGGLCALRLRLPGARLGPGTGARPLLVELLVRLHGLRGDLADRRHQSAHATTTRVRAVLRELVDLDVAGAARTAFSGWTGDPVPRTEAEFVSVARSSLELAELAAAHAWTELGSAIDSYRRYLDMT